MYSASSNNVPVYVVEFGKWDYRSLVQMSPKKIEEFWMYFEQCARRAERDSASSNNEGTVFILDWDGFNLKSYASARGRMNILLVVALVLHERIRVVMLRDCLEYFYFF